MSDMEHQRDTYRRWWQQVAGERDEARDELRRSRDAHNLAIRERDALQADLDNTVREKHRIEMERDGFRDEVAGFEAMWEQREKAHDAETEALRAQLATAKREALTALCGQVHGRNDDGTCKWVNSGDCSITSFRDTHYPATPSGAAKWDISEPRNPTTPPPEAREVRKNLCFVAQNEDGEVMRLNDSPVYVKLTPADAKRIVALARTGGTE